MFHCSMEYYILWVNSLWIVLFCTVAQVLCTVSEFTMNNTIWWGHVWGWRRATWSCAHIALGLLVWELSTHNTHVALELLPQRWTHPYAPHGVGIPAWGLGKPLRTRDAWAALGVSHAHAPLGDTWHVGHGAGPQVSKS